jgi:hypothetical protein
MYKYVDVNKKIYEIGSGSWHCLNKNRLKIDLSKFTKPIKRIIYSEGGK